MTLPSLIPAFVDSYDAATRMCRVRIPGYTDGAALLPEAELVYPIGYRSEDSELRILNGDRVWLAFRDGDPRYPIIYGFRTRATDNAIDVRRLAHANIELLADTDMTVSAGTGRVYIKAGTLVKVEAPSIELHGPVVCKQTLRVEGSITGTAGINVSGAMVNNGIPVGSGHKHNGVRFGGDISNVPIATP